MAHAATHTLVGFEADAATKAPMAAKTLAGKNLFTRLADAFMESRLRAAEREIARHRHLIDRFSKANDTADLPFTRG